MKLWKEVLVVICICVGSAVASMVTVAAIVPDPVPQAKCVLINKMDAYYLIKIEGNTNE